MLSTILTRSRLSPGQFPARVRRVARLYGRVVREGMGDRKLLLIVVTGMSFLGASAQAGTIAVLNYFVKAIESDVPRVIPYLGLPIGSDARTLALLTTLVLGLQVVSAAASYYVAVTSRGLGRRFHLKSAARIVEDFSRSPYLRPGHADARLQLRSAISSYPRVMGKAIEQMVTSVQTICNVIGFLVVLIQINLEISLFTLPVFLLVLPFLYRLSANTQQAAKAFFGEAGREVSRFALDQLQVGDQTNVHPALYAQAQEQQLRDSEAMRSYLDSFDEILLAQRRSILITSLFRGFLLCLILVVLGAFAVRQAYSWGELLVFVLALWQLANQVQRTTASLVRLNRYQPRINWYYETRELLLPKADDAPAARLEEPLVITSLGRLEGDAGRLEARRGDRIFYLTEAALGRMAFAEVLAPLLAAAPDRKRILRAASFCTGVKTAPKLGLAGMVLGSDAPSGDERARLEARIAELGLAAELAALPDGSATFLSEESWSAISQKLRVALRLLSLSESSSEILFVDWELVGSVEKDFAKRLLALLDERIVFLVSSDGRIECGWAEGFVVSEEGAVVGVGDARWWAEILPYRRQRLPSLRGPEYPEDEEEDEEDTDM